MGKAILMLFDQTIAMKVVIAMMKTSLRKYVLFRRLETRSSFSKIGPVILVGERNEKNFVVAAIIVFQ